MARGPASRFGQQPGGMAENRRLNAMHRWLMASALVLALLVPTDSFSLAPRSAPFSHACSQSQPKCVHLFNARLDSGTQCGRCCVIGQ
eukprot:1705817-Rhodomonas_salina.3